MATYYRTPINTIEALEVVAMCDDLLALRPYQPRELYDLPLWKWFHWFFKENPISKITKDHFPPYSPLVTKIEKLSGTAIYKICEEIAADRGLYFEPFATKNLLTFLKKIYASKRL